MRVLNSPKKPAYEFTLLKFGYKALLPMGYFGVKEEKNKNAFFCKFGNRVFLHVPFLGSVSFKFAATTAWPPDGAIHKHTYCSGFRLINADVAKI